MSTSQVETACEGLDLHVFHIGYRGQELRLFFRGIDTGRPTYVAELHGVHSFFDRGAVSGQPVLFAVHADLGSFGWAMRAEERLDHSEVFLFMKSDPVVNPFRAIVRRVVEREITRSDEQNWPG